MFLTAVCLLSSCGVTRQVVADADVVRALKDKKFIMYCEYMYPAGFPMQVIDGGYYIEIKDNMVSSALPYIGSAEAIAYGGGDGYNYKEPMKSYSAKKSGDSVEINIKVKTSDDELDMRFKIYYDGDATLNIVSLHRSYISYRGRVEPLRNEGEE